MSEHTETPWKVEEGVDGFPDIVSEDCGEIVGCEGFYSELDRDWANARHIVHCVNNHERLVEALRDLLDEYECQESQYGSEYLWQKHAGNEAEKARTLLADLEAEKGGEL